VVSDDGDNDDTILPGEVISCPSSYASLRMCYVNEAAFDDDDDDVDCYREELITGPMASPDLIAGMRRPAEQVCVTAKKTALNETPSHSYGVSLAIWDHTVLPSTRHK